MGRKSIKIERISNDRTRLATFNKRKLGLIKKAMELSILCDCEVGLIVIGGCGNKLTQYSSCEMEMLLMRYAEGKFDEPCLPLTNANYPEMFDKPHKKSKKKDKCSGVVANSSFTCSNSKRVAIPTTTSDREDLPPRIAPSPPSYSNSRVEPTSSPLVPHHHSPPPTHTTSSSAPSSHTSADLVVPLPPETPNKYLSSELFGSLTPGMFFTFPTTPSTTTAGQPFKPAFQISPALATIKGGAAAVSASLFKTQHNPFTPTSTTNSSNSTTHRPPATTFIPLPVITPVSPSSPFPPSASSSSTSSALPQTSPSTTSSTISSGPSGTTSAAASPSAYMSGSTPSPLTHHSWPAMESFSSSSSSSSSQLHRDVNTNLEKKRDFAAMTSISSATSEDVDSGGNSGSGDGHDDKPRKRAAPAFLSHKPCTIQVPQSPPSKQCSSKWNKKNLCLEIPPTTSPHYLQNAKVSPLQIPNDNHGLAQNSPSSPVVSKTNLAPASDADTTSATASQLASPQPLSPHSLLQSNLQWPGSPSPFLFDGFGELNTPLIATPGSQPFQYFSSFFAVGKDSEGAGLTTPSFTSPPSNLGHGNRAPFPVPLSVSATTAATSPASTSSLSSSSSSSSSSSAALSDSRATTTFGETKAS
ncbi:putative Floral homeotic protein APETALA [Balamuthia mandrillaris]